MSDSKSSGAIASRKRSRDDILNEERENEQERASVAVEAVEGDEEGGSPRVKRRKSVNTYEYRNTNGELIKPNKELNKLIMDSSRIETIKNEIKQELKQELLKETSEKFDKLQVEIDSLKEKVDKNETEDDQDEDEDNKDTTEQSTTESTDETPQKKYVFGHSSFANFKSPLPADKESTEGPKRVFGASTPFGGTAFGSAPKTNVFDTLPASTPATSSSSSSTASNVKFGGFGANSKFGNAFQDTLNKKSIFDEPKKDDEDKGPEEEEEKSEVIVYKQVELTKQNVKTGEEEEESLFSSTCKLFELDLTDISKGWKERGIGQLHLNLNTNTGKSRIIVRSNGLLRVVLNIPIIKNLDFVKGMASSMQSEKFLRITTVNEIGPIQYSLKFGNGKLRDELFDKLADITEQLD